jgi:phosphonate transport system permease protein
MTEPLRFKNGRIRIRRLTAANLAVGLTLATLAAITIVGTFLLDGKGVDFSVGLAKTLADLGKMFLSPHAKHVSYAEAALQVGITLGLAFLTTVIGAVIALFLGLAAARNLADRRIGDVIKALMAVVRAVPTVLWVLIFAIGAGLGAAAAVIGMTFHTVGYLLKAYSESYEELDDGVIEALKASGASWWQIVFQAVLPASATYILSWTFIRFEINFVTAVAMGAAAGAGGIGFDLFMASSFYFDLHEVGFVTWLILAVAVALEIGANAMKARYITRR